MNAAEGAFDDRSVVAGHNHDMVAGNNHDVVARHNRNVVAGHEPNVVVGHEPNVVVGIGLDSKATSTDVSELIADALASIGRTANDVVTIATAEHRRGHPALIALTAFAGTDLAPIVFVPTAEFTGNAVCERAAAVASGGGEILVAKRCTAHVCVTIVEQLPP